MFELIRSAVFSGSTARAMAHVPADLPFLADHFPGVPVLPGSLQLELCAQIAGPLAEQASTEQHSIERFAFVGMIRNAVFHRPVRLPVDLEITAELRRVELSNIVVAVTANREGEQMCRAEIVFMMRESEPGWAEAIASARRRVAGWQV